MGTTKVELLEGQRGGPQIEQRMRRGRSTIAAGIFTVGVALLLSNSSSLLQGRSASSGMATAAGPNDLAKAIRDISIDKVRGPGEETAVKVGSFWKDQTAVIHVLRRFGCRLCRNNAAELSRVLPVLEANNVRVVAVGIESLGLQEFLDGGFWKGELYIDHGKKIAKALELKSLGYLSGVSMLLTNKDVKKALDKTKDVPGNFKGDGLQLGATFVVSKTGETLLDFRQKNFADHPSSVSILQACGLDPSLIKDVPGCGKGEEVCDDACST